MSLGDGGTDRAQRVFLSYARSDAERAHALADALTARGFSVWCDRQIEGGAAFAAVIEGELAAADAVVVAWSQASARSDWVRDEAAVGRDKGRLVPVRLDATQPPIGFRQYQAIDLSAWGGAPDDPVLDRLARALHKTAQAAPAPTTAASAARPPRRRRVLFGASAVAIAAVTAALVWQPWRPPPAVATTPTIAVLPFLDTSNTPDGRAFAQGVAEEILNLLARDPRLHVLGRTSSGMLAAHAGDPRAIERDLGVTHLLEGSVRTAPGRVKVGVRLVALPGARSLFAEDYDRRPTDIFAVQNEIGRAVAARLGGALGTAAAVRAAAAPQTTPDVYARYLAARELTRSREPPKMKRARTLLQQAIAADPRYAPAFAGLAEIAVLLAADQYGETPVPAAIAAARGYAQTAAGLAPNLSESRAALGMAAIEAGEGARAIAEFRRAVALDPGRVETLNWLGYALSQTGELRDAAAVMRQAVAREPLWFRPRVTAIFTLRQIGAYDEIARMAKDFGPIAPDTLSADRVAMAAALWLGHNAQAAALAKRVLAANAADPQAVETLSIVGISLFRFDLALQVDGEAPSITNDLMRGDPDAAIARAAEMGSALWQSNKDAYYATVAFGQLGQWAKLAALYDAQSKSPQEWLGAASNVYALQVAPTVALALGQVGRTEEAALLRRVAMARLNQLERYGLSANAAAWTRAALLTHDDPARAIAELARIAASVDPGIVCSGPVRLDRSPEFAVMAADPRFRMVVARCDEWLGRQRADLSRARPTVDQRPG